MKLSFPIVVLPVLLGPEHTVRGQISAVEAPLADSGLRCPPLGDITLDLQIFYLLPNGDDWSFPRKRWARENYYAGYDILMVSSNTRLQQEETIATTKVSPDGSFAFTWKEFATANRTPYLEVYWVTEENRDPNRVEGYNRITVKRVYVITGHKDADPPRFPVFTTLVFTPNVFLEFYGNETEKMLPNLTGKCIPYLGG